MSAAEEFTFSFATSRDLPAVKELLATCGLPNEDVDQHLRYLGLAGPLCRQMIIRARSSGITRLYLLTETEEGLFRKYGFAPVERAAVPREIQTTNEFSKLCPDTATVMVKEL